MSSPSAAVADAPLWRRGRPLSGQRACRVRAPPRGSLVMRVACCSMGVTCAGPSELPPAATQRAPGRAGLFVESEAAARNPRRSAPLTGSLAMRLHDEAPITGAMRASGGRFDGVLGKFCEVLRREADRRV